jgi:L-asparaginase
MAKKNILILNTGGTISSVKSADGYKPQQGYVTSAMRDIRELKHKDMPNYDIIEYQPLIDSSNMGVEDWNQLGQDIADNYENYDGFVVFHGTDTMAYTASALSFMLEHIQKPVIITGSQIPLSEIRNDASENIITSLWLAGNDYLKEVCIFFNHRLLRGNRTQKVSSHRFSAFDSPNFPHLAFIGITIDLQKQLLLPLENKAFNLQKITPRYIANFRLFPGFSTKVVSHMLEQPLEGLILESYGIGNAQSNDVVFLNVLADATKRGVIIINCSQCYQASVNMDSYATGRSLKKAGLISGFDMTPEAAHCKLLYLLAKGFDGRHIQSLMQQDLRGELSL